MMQMARSLFLLHPVRASLTQRTSPPPSLFLASRNSLNLKSLLLSTLPKHFGPGKFKHGWKLFAQGLQFSNLSKSGNYSSMKRICGLSITFGSIYLWPKIASAMDGFEVLVDDYDDRMNYMSASEAEEKYRDLLALVRKLLLPIYTVLTVVTNWGQPILLVIRVMLTLITTKPSPFSVYLSIEELLHQHMKQGHPIVYQFKSMYAKKIDIEDYALLCVAKVEIDEESLTLIGILGSWWVLPSLQIEEAFVAVKKRLSDTYSTRYIKDSK